MSKKCMGCVDNRNGWCVANQVKIPVSGICMGSLMLSDEPEDMDGDDLDDIDTCDFFGHSEELHTTPPIYDEPNEWTGQFKDYMRQGEDNIHNGDIDAAGVFFTAANAIANSGLMRGYIKM